MKTKRHTLIDMGRLGTHPLLDILARCHADKLKELGLNREWMVAEEEVEFPARLVCVEGVEGVQNWS